MDKMQRKYNTPPKDPIMFLIWELFGVYEKIAEDPNKLFEVIMYRQGIAGSTKIYNPEEIFLNVYHIFYLRYTINYLLNFDSYLKGGLDSVELSDDSDRSKKAALETCVTIFSSVDVKKDIQKKYQPLIDLMDKIECDLSDESGDDQEEAPCTEQKEEKTIKRDDAISDRDDHL